MRTSERSPLVGAGQTGGTLAHLAGSHRNSATSFCSTLPRAFRRAKVLDLVESSPVDRLDARYKGANDYRDIEGADVVIVTAGVPRKPGMSRDDLVDINLKVMESVGNGRRQYAPECLRHLHHQPARCDGVGAARSSRACRPNTRRRHGRRAQFGPLPAISSPKNSAFRSKDVTAFVLGGHGDDDGAARRATRPSAGIPLPDLVKMGWITQGEDSTQIVQRTRDGGAEIVALLKTGSAFYAPAASAIAMAESYLKDQAAAFCPAPPISRANMA